MKIVIQKHPIKGRAVFATEPIMKGEIIETCELLLLKLESVPEELEGYAYQYSKGTAAIALGNGSLLNHSKKANCDFSFNYKKQHLYIRAKKVIKAGEEITINYRYDSESKKRFKIRE